MSKLKFELFARFFCLALLASGSVIADEEHATEENTKAGHRDKKIELKSDHPQEYRVQIGDTLWGISSKFLKNPWLWPNVWNANSQISNPHLIYPGNLIRLVYIDGKPQLTISRRGAPMVKLSPQGHMYAASKKTRTSILLLCAAVKYIKTRKPKKYLDMKPSSLVIVKCRPLAKRSQLTT